MSNPKPSAVHAKPAAKIIQPTLKTVAHSSSNPYKQSLPTLTPISELVNMIQASHKNHTFDNKNHTDVINPLMNDKENNHLSTKGPIVSPSNLKNPTYNTSSRSQATTKKPIIPTKNIPHVVPTNITPPIIPTKIISPIILAKTKTSTDMKHKSLVTPSAPIPDYHGNIESILLKTHSINM